MILHIPNGKRFDDYISASTVSAGDSLLVDREDGTGTKRITMEQVRNYTGQTAQEQIDDLQAQINNLQNTPTMPIIGTYTGNGASSRAISLGFAPRFGIVYAAGTYLFQDSYSLGTSTSSFAFLSDIGSSDGVTRTATGFTVEQVSGNVTVPTMPWMNRSGTVYVYAVWK